MPTKLKLHRDEPDLDPAIIPETYKFPGLPAQRQARSRTRSRAPAPLVAARVPGSPLAEVAARREPSRQVSTPCAVVTENDGDACAGRIMNSRDLVREIESTLDRMQSRLDSFRRQVDASSPIPFSDLAGPDDAGDSPNRPRAA